MRQFTFYHLVPKSPGYRPRKDERLSRPSVKVLNIFLIYEFYLKVLMSCFPFIQTVRFYFLFYLIR